MKLEKDRKYAGNKHFTEYLKQPLIDSFMIKPTDKTEIESLISKIYPTKKTGPNSIHNKLIKLISKVISTPISNMISLVT